MRYLIFGIGIFLLSIGSAVVSCGGNNSAILAGGAIGFAGIAALFASAFLDDSL